MSNNFLTKNSLLEALKCAEILLLRTLLFKTSSSRLTIHWWGLYSLLLLIMQLPPSLQGLLCHLAAKNHTDNTSTMASQWISLTSIDTQPLCLHKTVRCTSSLYLTMCHLTPIPILVSISPGTTHPDWLIPCVLEASEGPVTITTLLKTAFPLIDRLSRLGLGTTMHWVKIQTMA